ncbi:MAG: Mitochondrial ATPase complex subunit atp10 [Peltula sp. TS41687]|nr:MAG: Mitochondrial ATPase complex subunit atp10 [Peltula sp. TS41687]
MLQPTRLLSLRAKPNNSCILCFHQAFHTTTPRPDTAHIPRPKPGKDSHFKPQPLTRPIGLPHPPRAGENIGIDTRTWRQRRADFFNHDKHLERRQQLVTKFATPYFREWTNMRHAKGKSFVAPPRLFRAERALYFPNLRGRTLASPSASQVDTTPVLAGNVSVVSVFSGTWAEQQAESFVGAKDNADLHELLFCSEEAQRHGAIQRVDINVEENAMKDWLIRMFAQRRLRRKLPVQQHGRYFVVTKGVGEEVRDAIGLLNSKVGYVYLLDGKCRIRWAGSGVADEEERRGLLRGARRLVEEWRRERGLDGDGSVEIGGGEREEASERVAAAAA